MTRDEIKAAAARIAAEEREVLFPPPDWLYGDLHRFGNAHAQQAWDFFECRIANWKKMSFEERCEVHEDYGQRSPA